MPRLKEAGLTHLNLSIDSLVPAKFDFITRRHNGLQRVLETIDLSEGQFEQLKLNVVLMRSFNDDEVLDFCSFVHDRDIELRFIEFMPFDENKWSSDRMVPNAEVLDTIQSKFHLEKLDDPATAVAKTWRFKEGKA